MHAWRPSIRPSKSISPDRCALIRSAHACIQASVAKWTSFVALPKASMAKACRLSHCQRSPNATNRKSYQQLNRVSIRFDRIIRQKLRSYSFSCAHFVGGGVVTSRAHVHYVVTEYGIAYLFGKSIRQRAHALIQIAHPDHREALEKAAFERMKCMPTA